LKRFPTVTVFDVDEMIRRIQLMVKQVTRAIEWVLILVLLAGLLVLVATVQASMDQRLLENTLLRSLGASRRLLLGSLWLEFSLLGCLAGLLAAGGAMGVTWALQQFVFKVAFSFYGWPWIAGPVLGMFLVSVTGLLACVHVVRMPPWRLLQEQAS
jgi:putative ABC transport system permease protein